MFDERLKRGLYDYREEHDACGIGFYANMNNLRSHDIIENHLKCCVVLIIVVVLAQMV